MSDQGTQSPPAGWYPDPQGPGNERWFDGRSWTTGVRPVAEPVPVWQAPQEQRPAPPPQQPAFQQPYQAPAGQQPYQQTTTQQPYQAPTSQPYQSPSTQPAYQQPWQQPEKRRMSTGAKVLIALGIVIGGFVVLGILAAIAIPVFLNQRSEAQAAELSAVTCQALAGQVAVDSAAAPTEDGHWLVEVADAELVEDARDSFSTPSDGDEAFVLSCVATAVWDDLLEEPVQIDLYVDSEMERVYYLSWAG